MDKEILFFILGAIIWVFQMVVKSRTKSIKNKGTYSQNEPSDNNDLRFFTTLKQFSSQLGKEMRLDISSSTPKDVKVHSVKNEVMNNKQVVFATEEESDVVTKRKQHHSLNKLKSTKGLREAFINSEILKTKF